MGKRLLSDIVAEMTVQQHVYETVGDLLSQVEQLAPPPPVVV
jgi:hypothetical protein